ncbi:MAG: cytochrome ubiquinol oxidase subunit I [Verrucomicrobiae bacterium]|nr:cytochrome ubiquinol oxidase subunit I [Verrucomicrobiae bacterium]
MDVLLLSRIQFAFTIAFHYIYPPLSIGLGVLMVIMEGLHLKTGEAIYHQMAKFWTRIFALTFAIGVATGIVMEFEFGTNWAVYSRFVGDVFGSALAAEGIFAFFLESGFLAVLLFGWDKVGKKMHFFATCMVCLGAHFSAVWIVVANSWMQTPAGYHIVGEGINARAQIVDFWAMVFNPSSMDRLAHTLIGCWQAGAWMMISISAYYIYRNRHLDFAKRSLAIALSVACVASVLQLISGSSSAQVVVKHQPAKLAAMEGIFKTEPYTPMYIFGWVDVPNEKVYGLYMPGGLSFLAYKNFETPVKGFDQAAPDPKDRPPIQAVFQLYHLMIGIGMGLIGLSYFTAFAWWRGWLFRWKWLQIVLIFSVLGPQIANQAGWFTAEMGRQPWIVYGLMRTSEGLSEAVKAEAVIFSLILFGFVYLLLFAVFIFLLNMKIQHGPEEQSHDSVPAQPGPRA